MKAKFTNKLIILFMFLSVFAYSSQSHKNKIEKKKLQFNKVNGLETRHNNLVKNEKILPFVSEKYNSAILKGGQVFTNKKVSESRMNIKNKKSKNYVFDIHTSKDVGCVKCHSSRPQEKNKPANYTSKINTLIDQAGIDSYLGKKHNNVEAFEVKTCIDCHKKDVKKHEAWLPATSNHMDKMSCETCHINNRDMFTAKSFNYALVNDNEEPFISYLGLDFKPKKPVIVGFKANNIWYKGKTDKNIKIKPANMVSFLVWKDADKFVDSKLLKKAFYNENILNSELLKAFDKNNDNKLSVKEANFDSKAKKTVAIKLLKAAGVKNPKLKLISFPVALEHNVMPKEMATKSCASCHNTKAKSELHKDAELLDYNATSDIDVIIPGASSTKFAKLVNGKIVLDKNALPKEHMMMVTDTSNKDFDQYAIILLIATILGLLGHGMLRIMFASKRNSKE